MQAEANNRDRCKSVRGEYFLIDFRYKVTINAQYFVSLHVF